MSSINTNGINVNYPVPGVNNNTQGFRDNFANIKTNIDKASTEITELQNNVIVKSPLTGIPLNNDMANTLISNALVQGFRATTFSLGTNVSGSQVIDISKGDVQIGTITANTTLTFANWAPTGTQSNVQIFFNIANTAATLGLPSEVKVAGGYGINTIQNAEITGSTSVISFPKQEQVGLKFSTLDCGANVYIEPINNPRVSTEITTGDPNPAGDFGDVPGSVRVSNELKQLPIASTNAADYFVTSGNTSQLYPGMKLNFTGVSWEANISIGTDYYVRNVVNSTQFTVATSDSLSANVNLAGGSGTGFDANPASYLYICTDTFEGGYIVKSASDTNTSGNITLNNTTNLEVNMPIVFSGTVFGGIVEDQVYFIKSIGSGGNIKISQNRYNGVASNELVLTTASGTMTLTANNGKDIWKRIRIDSW